MRVRCVCVRVACTPFAAVALSTKVKTCIYFNSLIILIQISRYYAVELDDVSMKIARANFPNIRTVGHVADAYGRETSAGKNDVTSITKEDIEVS